MHRVLVTGGAGYLGSILSRRLVDKGYEVLCLDRLYFGDKPVALLLGHPNFQLVQANIVDIADHAELMEGVDAVIHLAGLANDPSCDLDPRLTEAVNERSTVELAELAKESGVSRFLFASSCSVYGQGGDEVLTENSPLKPVSLYATSKVRCEEALQALADERFSPVMLRQATLFGYSPRMRFDLAINIMTLHAVTKRRIIVMGGGQQWRPFLHIRDAAEAFIACLEAPREAIHRETFNVGSPWENYKILDLAALVKEVHPEIEIEIAPSDEDKRSYRVNFNRIAAVLGWKAKISCREGIQEVSEAIRDGRLADLDHPVYYNIHTLKGLFERPAVLDGEPLRPVALPFCLPTIGEEEEKEVIDTLRSGWITTGPKTKRFEQMLVDYTGAEHVLALNSCTAALHLSLVALEVGPGDEVITSPITWPSTANVIIHTGATPVFADLDPATLNIDPEAIEAAITERTKAIIPVHMAGFPCDLDRIHAVAQGHGLAVVEDAAHALGANYKGEKIGAISEFTCFSFYPIKNITTIEGGALATNNAEWAETARLYSLHGISRDAWKRYQPGGSLHWELLAPGFKYNMSDVQASLGIHQLPRLDSFIATRRRHAERYREAFAALPEIETFFQEANGVLHAHHLFIIALSDGMLNIDRDGLMEALKAENIATGVHFRSLHIQPYYRETFGYRPEDFPRALDLSNRILSLPLYPTMTYQDVGDVIRAVKKLVRFYRSAKPSGVERCKKERVAQ